MDEKKYQPSPEDVKKAQNTMTLEQEVLSRGHEEGFSVGKEVGKKEQAENEKERAEAFLEVKFYWEERIKRYKENRSKSGYPTSIFHLDEDDPLIPQPGTGIYTEAIKGLKGIYNRDILHILNHDIKKFLATGQVSSFSVDKLKEYLDHLLKDRDVLEKVLKLSDFRNKLMSDIRGIEEVLYKLDMETKEEDLMKITVVKCEELFVKLDKRIKR